jgi:hypothetical protein
MESIEASNQSFVIKVWLEETKAKGRSARWRGRITHVPSGDQRYVENLEQITDFISQYLERVGVKPSLFQRLRRNLRRRKNF